MCEHKCGGRNVGHKRISLRDAKLQN